MEKGEKCCLPFFTTFVFCFYAAISIDQGHYKSFCPVFPFVSFFVCLQISLNLSQTSPGFHVSAVEVFWKRCGKRRNCSEWAISYFPTLFSIHYENFLQVSSNMKLLSANSFSLDGLKFIVLERVNPFPNKPLFLYVCSTSLLKTLREKEKLLITSNFSFSLSVFYLFWRTFCHFHFEIVIC